MQYFKHHLWTVDLALARRYSFGRAYTISIQNRPVLPKGTGQMLTYGETPLSTFQQILSWISPFPPCKFAEMGCGTGRLSLMLSKSYQISCVGVDLVQSFVDNANQIARQQNVDCSFVCADILTLDWSTFDLVYITSTTYSSDLLAAVWDKCATLPVGAKVITLTHAPPKERLTLLKMDVLPFSWGVATVYLTVKTH